MGVEDIPSPRFPCLPAVLDQEMAAWSWHLGRFVHSCHKELLQLLISVVFLSCLLQTPLYQASLKAIPGPVIDQLRVLSGPHFHVYSREIEDISQGS